MSDERNQDYYEREFQVLADSNGFLVGTQETQTRMLLGDKGYEKFQARNEDAADLNLQMTAARIGHVNAVSHIILSGSIVIRRLIPLLAIGWSIFLWVH